MGAGTADGAVPEGTGIGVLGPGWVACGVAGRLAGTGRVRWSRAPATGDPQDEARGESPARAS